MWYKLFSKLCSVCHRPYVMTRRTSVADACKVRHVLPLNVKQTVLDFGTDITDSLLIKINNYRRITRSLRRVLPGNGGLPGDKLPELRRWQTK